MARAIESVLRGLEALTVRDFDYSIPGVRGLERLAALCDELTEIGDAETAAPVMFGVMERCDGADLGSPGSLVHTLEQWPGRYERFLIESLERKPTFWTVWMVNRILNTDPADAREWKERLTAAAGHVGALEETRERARGFLRYQASR